MALITWIKWLQDDIRQVVDHVGNGLQIEGAGKHWREIDIANLIRDPPDTDRIVREMAKCRQTVLLQGHPAGTQITEFGHGDLNALLFGAVYGETMVEALIPVENQIGDAVIGQKTAYEVRPVRQPSAKGCAVRAVPVQPVTRTQVDTENVMAGFADAVSDLAEERR